MPIPIRWSDPLQAAFGICKRATVLLAVALPLAGCSLFSEADSGVRGDAEAIAFYAAPPLTAQPAIPETARAAVLPVRKPSVTSLSSTRVMPELLGRGQPEIVAALGEPQTRDADRSAQRWRYASADCALELLFFFDIASERYRLAVISRDGRAVSPAQAGKCLPPVPAKPMILS
jgi:hypothetical protein